jgi:hypothetical protein
MEDLYLLSQGKATCFLKVSLHALDYKGWMSKKNFKRGDTHPFGGA